MKAQVRKDVERKLSLLNGTKNRTALNLMREFAQKGFLSKKELKILDKLVAVRVSRAA